MHLAWIIGDSDLLGSALFVVVFRGEASNHVGAKFLVVHAKNEEVGEKVYVKKYGFRDTQVVLCDEHGHNLGSL